jgi:hypothetical protein
VATVKEIDDLEDTPITDDLNDWDGDKSPSSIYRAVAKTSRKFVTEAIARNFDS